MGTRVVLLGAIAAATLVLGGCGGGASGTSGASGAGSGASAAGSASVDNELGSVETSLNQLEHEVGADGAG